MASMSRDEMRPFPNKSMQSFPLRLERCSQRFVHLSTPISDSTFSMSHSRLNAAFFQVLNVDSLHKHSAMIPRKKEPRFVGEHDLCLLSAVPILCTLPSPAFFLRARSKALVSFVACKHSLLLPLTFVWWWILRC